MFHLRYCDGGDLLGLVKSQSGKILNENYVLDIFVQLALAIKHVHDRKIIHRDIKTENIFLSSQKRVVKLGDFGIAKVLENTLQQARTSIGTPYYLSPEICQGKLYNFKSDIWSLGVVLYELCALRCPFAGANMKGLMLCISKGSYAPIPSSFSSDMRKLIADMLNLNPKLRPSINDLLRRPILQQRISKLIEGSVLRQEFSHTVLHGQHYSKAKCSNPAALPASSEVSEPSIAADKHKVVALKRFGHDRGNPVECINISTKAEPDARCALISRQQLVHAHALERDNVIDNVMAGKLERERRDQEIARVMAEKRQSEDAIERERQFRAAIAEKAERDKRGPELAKVLAAKREYEIRLEREKREKEIARHKDLHQFRIGKQAEVAFAAAFCADRAEEEKMKQKRREILALEEFRQKQAKQWLGGVAHAMSPTPSPAGRCLVRNDIVAPSPIQDIDMAVAKRLWSAKSPALNSVDQVKARGAAQKIEEQQKYERALAIARKQAYLERLAAEDRRQRELHSALQDEQLQAIKHPVVEISRVSPIGFSDHVLPPSHNQPESALPSKGILSNPSNVDNIDHHPLFEVIDDVESNSDNQASEIAAISHVQNTNM
jgi:NIMA (never in mitosis gene a)-related kinase